MSRDGRDPPPRLAQMLARALADAAVRDSFLGDLEEEFGQGAKSARDARARYWREIISSTPMLIVGRLSRFSWQSVAAAMFVALSGYIAVWTWNDAVVHPATTYLSGAFAWASGSNIRATYFLAQVFGAGLTGFIISMFAFRAGDTFARNAATFLLPLATCVAVSGLAALISGRDYFSTMERLAWIAAMSSALAAGAWIRTRWGTWTDENEDH